MRKKVQNMSAINMQKGTNYEKVKLAKRYKL